MDEKNLEPTEPLGFNLHVKPFPTVTKTLGGIILPDASLQRPDKGTVVAVAKQLSGVDYQPQVGDIVFTVKGSGTKIGEEIYLFRNVDCLSRIPKSEVENA